MDKPRPLAIAHMAGKETEKGEGNAIISQLAFPVRP